MPEQITEPRKFLNKFTEEIIMAVKSSIEVDERRKIEEERMKRAIETEKLKQKFSQYAVPEKLPSAPVKIESRKKPLIKEIKEEPIPAITKKPDIPIVKKIIEPVIKTIPIPETRPVEPGEIDFGKINFLVKDPLISYVECPGENRNVIIKRAGGLATRTQIVLTKEEIFKIVNSFSEKARIPLIEGMLDARIGTLEMSAVISESSSSSFIVKRNLLPPPKTETVLQRPIQPQATMPRMQSMMPSINTPFRREI